jgi:NAD(P)-dependent dehydrogenase (short-subunit alcohol dehydrogenase family)
MPPLEALTLVEWNRVLATDLTSVFLAAKYAARHLRASRGAIVNIASTRPGRYT